MLGPAIQTAARFRRMRLTRGNCLETMRGLSPGFSQASTDRMGRIAGDRLLTDRPLCW